MGTDTTLIVLSGIVSVLTLLAIGGNDVPDSQGTAVGSGALSKRGAQIIAAICEFAGAVLVGQQVSDTIGSKMVESDASVTPVQYCWGMFSGLLSVGVWMLIATAIKMPVSATHSIIGALFGLNLVITNWDWTAADWPVLGKIAIAWIVTPLLSFGASFFMLAILNIYWPSDGERDSYFDEESFTPPTIEPSQRSTLITFVMAPPSAKMTPIGAPSPKRLARGQNTQLTWAAATEKKQDIDEKQKETDVIAPDPPPDEIDDDDDDDDEEEEHMFEPQRFKFALFFGILMATLVIFIMIGGPKSINIEDGPNEVDDWVIVVVAFTSLAAFVIIGYLIEGCYRSTYSKIFYSKKEDGEHKYDAVELANTKKDITPPPHDNDENKTKTASSHGDYAKMDDKEKEKLVEEEKEDRDESVNHFNSQDYFRLYLVVASGSVAFAHGGNDVANVLGPFGQIYKYVTTGSLEGELEIPAYVAGAAGLCIALGFVLLGAPVLETIGKSITKLSYRSGFTAQFCAAATVLVCNVLGLPVSSSTVIVGGVSGVGYYNARERRKRKRDKWEQDEVEYVGCINTLKYLWAQQNIRVLCKILAIWIITIPANAVICGGTYALINLAL